MLFCQCSTKCVCQVMLAALYLLNISFYIITSLTSSLLHYHASCQHPNSFILYTICAILVRNETLQTNWNECEEGECIMKLFNNSCQDFNADSSYNMNFYAALTQCETDTTLISISVRSNRAGSFVKYLFPPWWHFTIFVNSESNWFKHAS